MLDVSVHLDPNGKDITVSHVQDVAPILNWNKEARKEEQRSEWGRHVARIPNVILVRWLDEEARRGNLGLRMGTEEFDNLVDRKLKDPEWAYLRTDRPALQVGFS